MIPKSLSATSLQVASQCMSRWKTEYLDRTPGFGGVAANIGTSVHGALEMFVKMVVMEKSAEWDWKLLEDLYKVSYVDTFGTGDYDTPEYKDGLDMLKRWFKRTDFDGVTVESCEVKETIDIPVVDKTTGEKFTIPFNYIMDRVDQISETEYRVVDYKSIRVPIDPEELEGKIQARCYALAIQIKHPEATKIRVVFDLLRHDPVGIVVSREDNVATWKYLKSEAQRIVDLDESDVRPTLNMECCYCVMKSNCELLAKHIRGNGVHSLSIAEVVQKKVELEAQMKGQKYLLEELDTILLKEAVNRDELEWETEAGKVEVKMSRRRQVDASLVAKIIGPEMFGQLGSITIGVVNDLIKDPNLTPEQQAQLESLIYYKTGDPKPKVKPRKALI